MLIGHEAITFLAFHLLAPTTVYPEEGGTCHLSLRLFAGALEAHFMLVAMLDAVGFPHTVAWQSLLLKCRLQYSSVCCSKGRCCTNSAVIPKLTWAVGRASGAEQSLDRGPGCAGELWGGRGVWWAAGGSPAGLPARERPLGCVWGTM